MTTSAIQAIESQREAHRLRLAIQDAVIELHEITTNPRLGKKTREKIDAVADRLSEANRGDQ